MSDTRTQVALLPPLEVLAAKMRATISAPVAVGTNASCNSSDAAAYLSKQVTKVLVGASGKPSLSALSAKAQRKIKAKADRQAIKIGQQLVSAGLIVAATPNNPDFDGTNKTFEFTPLLDQLASIDLDALSQSGSDNESEVAVVVADEKHARNVHGDAPANTTGSSDEKDEDAPRARPAGGKPGSRRSTIDSWNEWESALGQVKPDQEHNEDEYDYGKRRNSVDSFGKLEQAKIEEKNLSIEKQQDERKRRAEFRMNVAKEIVDTERSYVESLQKLEDVYLSPLEKMANDRIDDDKNRNKYWKKGLISPEDLAVIKSNIDTIRLTNEHFSKQLQQRVESWSEPDNPRTIGDLFLKFSKYFHTYIKYVTTHESAAEKLERLVSKSKKLAAFLNNARLRFQCSPMGMYMIMPIQRIPRYQLLLQELLKNTEMEHEDYMMIVSAAEQIVELAKHINTYLGAIDIRKELMRISRMFNGKAKIIAQGRKYIYHGEVMKKTRVKKGLIVKTEHEVLIETHLFLFNNLLIEAERRSKKKPYKEKNSHLINHRFHTNAEPANNKSSEHAIEITTGDGSFVVCCSDSTNKEEWLKYFEQAIEAQNSDQHNAPAILSPASDIQIIDKEPIEADTTCVCCSKILKNRQDQNNCNSCGRAVCDGCSRARTIIPATLVKEPQRVCDHCMLKLHAADVYNQGFLGGATPGGPTPGGPTPGYDEKSPLDAVAEADEAAVWMQYDLAAEDEDLEDDEIDIQAGVPAAPRGLDLEDSKSGHNVDVEPSDFDPDDIEIGVLARSPENKPRRLTDAEVEARRNAENAAVAPEQDDFGPGMAPGDALEDDDDDPKESERLNGDPGGANAASSSSVDEVPKKKKGKKNKKKKSKKKKGKKSKKKSKPVDDDDMEPGGPGAPGAASSSEDEESDNDADEDDEKQPGMGGSDEEPGAGDADGDGSPIANVARASAPLSGEDDQTVAQLEENIGTASSSDSRSCRNSCSSITGGDPNHPATECLIM
jgi:RhoGEF domain/FYVE zinc finger